MYCFPHALASLSILARAQPPSTSRDFRPVSTYKVADNRLVVHQNGEKICEGSIGRRRSAKNAAKKTLRKSLFINIIVKRISAAETKLCLHIHFRVVSENKLERSTSLIISTIRLLRLLLAREPSHGHLC